MKGLIRILFRFFRLLLFFALEFLFIVYVRSDTYSKMYGYASEYRETEQQP